MSVIVPAMVPQLTPASTYHHLPPPTTTYQHLSTSVRRYGGRHIDIYCCGTGVRGNASKLRSHQMSATLPVIKPHKWDVWRLGTDGLHYGACAGGVSDYGRLWKADANHRYRIKAGYYGWSPCSNPNYRTATRSRHRPLEQHTAVW